MTPDFSLANAIVVVGKSGSGKSTIVDKISKIHALKVVSFGALVRATALDRGLDENRSTLQEIGQNMFTDMGPYGILKGAMVHSGIKSCDSIVFDGVRDRAVLEEIRKISHTTVVVFLQLDVRRRYSRSLLKNPSISFREFVTTGNHPIESGIPQMAALADVLVDSALPIQDVWERVSEGLARLSTRQ